MSFNRSLPEFQKKLAKATQYQTCPKLAQNLDFPDTEKNLPRTWLSQYMVSFNTSLKSKFGFPGDPWPLTTLTEPLKSQHMGPHGAELLARADWLRHRKAFFACGTARHLRERHNKAARHPLAEGGWGWLPPKGSGLPRRSPEGPKALLKCF